MGTLGPTPTTDPARAAAALAEIDACPTVANIARTARELLPHRAALAAVPLRVACLSSFTFDPIRPALELQGLRAGFAMETYVAPFGQAEQELIDAASGLASFKADVVLIAIRLQDVCPPLYERFNALAAEKAEQLVRHWIVRLQGALDAFRKRSSAHVLIQNYDRPAVPALGIADAKAATPQFAVIDGANTALTTLADSFENVRVMDYDALVARHGRRNWTDPRMALFARIPVAPKHYWALAGFYVRHLRPLYGLSKKVLVLDADNTLWGGVVGDVGIGGIALGPDYPGNAYVAFQQRVLDLYHRGVVLCLASKNEPGTVEEVLEKHTEMVLRTEHFAAMRINWNPKPDNVRQMADTLNLGLDSFVFIDDSPVECEMMRGVLPQVLSITLPAEPAVYAGVIESLDCFDQWTVSGEDRQRGQLYRAEARRRESQSAAVDLPTFYRRLGMKMTLSTDEPMHVGRAAQMTNRTNQFNMHTIRCTEDDIRRFMEAPDHHVFTLALADRFGDNGIVGLAVVIRRPDAWCLHLLVMSCRVLGRTVEQTFVGWIAGQARAAGADRLVGEFVPTAKNQPFAGFYESCGFRRSEPQGDVECWSRPLKAADTQPPDWMELTVNRPTTEAG